MATPESRLSRQLSTADAVVVGLGAMIGTGVFVVWQPAAALAGPWLLAGLGVAAFAAFCNATSTAQLAAVHPRAGGVYHYGRERLGDHWGALAGYAFVFGKTASAATAALAVGTYAWPERSTVVALVSVLVVASVNLAGVTKTAGLTKVLVAGVVAVLTLVVVAGLASLADRPGSLDFTVVTPAGDVGLLGVLGSAALLFYAFAGYARITVLGEEVRDPRAIPRAVVISLVVVLTIYGLIGTTVLFVLGSDGAARASQPLRALVETAGADQLVPIVVAGAAIAALGTLLSLLAGIGRTAFAMAAERDLPPALAAVHDVRRVPHRAETVGAVATVLLVLSGDLAQTLASSAFAVLVYYALANVAAWRLSADERSWPRVLSVLGFVCCLALAFSLPGRTILIGTSVLAGAMLVRAMVLSRR